MAKQKDSRLKNAGVTGYNKPKRTPNHPKKSHVVVAKEGGKTKLIRFGQQGVTAAGKKTDKKSKARRKSFKARHAKNIICPAKSITTTPITPYSANISIILTSYI